MELRFQEDKNNLMERTKFQYREIMELNRTTGGDDGISKDKMGQNLTGAFGTE
jgi:hypothetical protein